MADLDRILYVRVDADLALALTARRTDENKRRPGVRFSKAALVRTLLWEALRPTPTAVDARGVAA